MNTHQSESFVRGFFLAGILCARAVNLRRCGGSRGRLRLHRGVEHAFRFFSQKARTGKSENATRTTAPPRGPLRRDDRATRDVVRGRLMVPAPHARDE